MKIGYLVPEFPGQTHGFFWREIRHLEHVGHQIEIFSTRRPTDGTTHAFSRAAGERTTYLSDFSLKDLFGWILALTAASSLLIRHEVQVLLSGSRKTWPRLFALAIVGARMGKLCRDAGIDHVHSHSCADAAYVAAFSKLSGGPDYSLTLHGDLSGYGGNHAFKFAHAKFIACVSKPLCREMASQFANLRGKFRVIAMGIDDDPRIAKAADDWSPQRTLKMVTVSRLHRMKGHIHAIAAAEKMVRQGYKIRYDIVGEGEFRDELESLISRSGMTEHIHIVGPVPNNEIKAMLCGYDVFVLPSLDEATPVAIMEAMSVGLPSLCSAVGGIPDMIRHGETGYLAPPGDVAGLTDILAKLADHPALRRHIGEQGREFAHANFLTSVSAAMLVDAIQE
ncbi:MAG: glycosyltransferase family 4 protein [Sphingopyxis solisilvae]|uniref:glycosyltransferase family 4 protein n=1 Tax=Sphingopyxis solisilvae TaxID=1886788 RepID=UPI00403750B7